MKKVVLLFTALAVVGCAKEMPTGKAFNESTQLKLNSASHWDVLANHEASMLAETVSSYQNLAVYIKKPSRDVPFLRGYRHLLTSRLVKEGVNVVTEPSFDTATVSYVIDWIQHPTHDYREDNALATPLTQGVYSIAATFLAKGVFDLTETAIDLIKVPAYTLANQFKPDFSTHTEVIITTQIVMGKSVLNSDSRVYYIEQANLPHYFYKKPKVKALPHHFNVTANQ